MQLEKNGYKISSLEKLCNLVKKHSNGQSLVDELIKERRKEAYIDKR